MAETRYSIRDMEATFGVSRSTIIYYEQLGILSPARQGDTGYRVYTEKDVFRLMRATILKNAGIQPKDLKSYLEDANSDEKIAESLRVCRENARYHQAIYESLEKLCQLKDRVGSIGLEDIEAYYVVWDFAERGFRGFASNTDLDALMDAMPIGGFGSYWEVSPFEENPAGHWCRTVPVRDAKFVSGFSSADRTIGGCRCLTCSVYWSDIFSELDEKARWRDRIQRALNDNGLKVVDDVFSPYCLPSDEGYFALFCIPVARVS
jgi:DNA-binding transcriptional MerR regulator